MKHKVKVTVLGTKLYPDLQQRYCANPSSGVCDGTRPVIFKIERIDEED